MTTGLLSSASPMTSLTRVPRDFDPIVYKKLNPDVAALGMDPFEHYLLYGQQRWYR